MEKLEASLKALLDEGIAKVLAEVATQLQTVETPVGEIRTNIRRVDEKLQHHSDRLDLFQTKVDMSMDAIAVVQQEQRELACNIHGGRGPPPDPGSHPGGHPQGRPGAQQQPNQIPTGTQATAHDVFDTMPEHEQHGPRRPYMPKMDFPKFDGTDVRIWVDQCETFFSMYQITESFKVSAATMNLVHNGAHWYQAFKLTNQCFGWPHFRAAILAEFEGNLCQDHMRELCTLKQTGSVENYLRQFNMLLYQVKLYDPTVGGLLVVTRFILGLKNELRAAVEVQLPETVAQAAQYASVQERVLERTRSFPQRETAKSYTSSTHKPESSQRNTTSNKLETGHLWKATQLKEFRRTNGLCYRCGEKYMAGHTCAQQTTTEAQAHAIQTQDILSDEVLDALCAADMPDESEMHLSVNAISLERIIPKVFSCEFWLATKLCSCFLTLAALTVTSTKI
ncbi:uncharacterized protein LOC112269252 [Brachypodium distachyon]|uniref:uncharacterized protein LOC112269252 n=1 Tax=Brachypodium distachyon TaxID=15368 RepID=UPI000D0D2635|nr:uncharacterized protein LOC112269252 [Brachypodium distachyon]|eukprot:XP_024311277.1 uncharacterized protein LOC112269252 [Brachypodium distachyon]